MLIEKHYIMKNMIVIKVLLKMDFCTPFAGDWKLRDGKRKQKHTCT